MISKGAGEDQEHAEVEEGEVVVGFAVAAGGDAAFGFEPGVGAFDWPAVAGVGVGAAEAAASASPDLAGRGAGGDGIAAAPGLGDARLDPALAQGLFELPRGVAAVGPQLAGLDVALGECLQQRQ